jgi:hypothetical protein
VVSEAGSAAAPPPWAGDPSGLPGCRSQASLAAQWRMDAQVRKLRSKAGRVERQEDAGHRATPGGPDVSCLQAVLDSRRSRRGHGRRSFLAHIDTTAFVVSRRPRVAMFHAWRPDLRFPNPMNARTCCVPGSKPRQAIRAGYYLGSLAWLSWLF